MSDFRYDTCSCNFWGYGDAKIINLNSLKTRDLQEKWAFDADYISNGYEVPSITDEEENIQEKRWTKEAKEMWVLKCDLFEGKRKDTQCCEDYGLCDQNSSCVKYKLP